MGVSHLKQVIAFVAMEPPIALEPQYVSKEKNKFGRSMLPINPSDLVCGQYAGYRDGTDGAINSDTETITALKTAIDHWRSEARPP